MVKMWLPRCLQVSVHLVSLWLLLRTYYLGYQDLLGADPVEAIIHFTGIGALNLLLLSLTVSPLVRRLRWPALMRLRRPLGLYACLYAVMHVMNYLVYDLQWRWSVLLEDVVSRPYITVGFTALYLLIVLAITSLPRLIRRLGKRWKPLHRSVYIAVGLAWVHFIWSLKSDVVEPSVYAILITLLLAERAQQAIRRRSERRRKRTGALESHSTN